MRFMQIIPELMKMIIAIISFDNAMEAMFLFCCLRKLLIETMFSVNVVNSVKK
jgi:hypothetical protein